MCHADKNIRACPGAYKQLHFIRLVTVALKIITFYAILVGELVKQHKCADNSGKDSE